MVRLRNLTEGTRGRPPFLFDHVVLYLKIGSRRVLQVFIFLTGTVFEKGIRSQCLRTPLLAVPTPIHQPGASSPTLVRTNSRRLFTIFGRWPEVDGDYFYSSV